METYIMYKLLIIDDEEIMRNGLSELIDWKTMGFEVVGNLEDGRDGIEFIKSNQVDVILTDIKMSFISGIDLAKYVMDHNLDIKIILISGFQEFELARQAIAYNVSHYLLKPPKFKDIQGVFHELKNQLDSERQSRLQEEMRKEHYEELLSFSKEQFFIDLFYGAYSEREDIASRLKMLDFKIDVDQSPCIVFHVTIVDYENFLSNNWSFGKDGLYQAIKNFFNTEDYSLLFYPVRNMKDKIQILCISQDQADIESLSDNLDQFAKTVKENAKKLLNLELNYKKDFNFSSIVQLAEKSPVDLFQSEEKDDNFNLLNQVKLLDSYISSGDFRLSEGLYENFINQMNHLDIRIICDNVSSLFDMIYSKLEENGLNMDQESRKTNWNEIKQLETIEQIRSWGKNELSKLVYRVEKEKNGTFENVIGRAKQYINENYNKDITLEDVADHIFLNPVYFSRLFKEQTGENYIDYLIKVRMENAVKLLQDPHYKVNQISEKVGYNSLRYFYKIFKRYKGQTPTEYRKSLWGDDETI